MTKQSKRYKCNDSTDHNGQSYDTPDSDEKPKTIACSSPLEVSLKSPDKSITENSKLENVLEAFEEEDKLMEFQTTEYKSQISNVQVF